MGHDCGPSFAAPVCSGNEHPTPLASRDRDAGTALEEVTHPNNDDMCPPRARRRGDSACSHKAYILAYTRAHTHTRTGQVVPRAIQKNKAVLARAGVRDGMGESMSELF